MLTASGLIAGEALLGLVWAGISLAPKLRASLVVTENPSYVLGLVVMAALGVLMIWLPMRSAGRPDEPAPPVAMM